MRTEGHAPGKSALVIIFIACALPYVISQFMRASVAVIAPDISRDLALDPSELGVLTGSFFLSFAAMQIPVGMALDRFGARKTMLTLFSAVVAGACLFAMGDDLLDLTLARIVMGIGCSTLLMGPLMIYGAWFPSDRFATLSGWQISAGSIGVLLSTAPLALIVEWIGWRGAFWGLVGFCLVVLIVILVFVKDHPPKVLADENPQPKENWQQSLKGVVDVMRTPFMPNLLAIHLIGYSAMASILTLWGGPYLADIQGLDAGGRGAVLMAMSVSVIIGLSLWGSVDRLMGSRKKPVLLAGSMSVVLLLALSVTANAPLWVVTMLLVLMGLNNGYVAIYMTHGRAIFAPRISGRGMTVLNMGNMGGVAILQIMTGTIVQAFGGTSGEAAPVVAYQAVFLFLGILLTLALIFYSRAPDIPPES